MSVTDSGITKPWNEATVSAGAEISADGSVVLKDQRTLNEDFSEALDAGIWGSVQAGSGEINLNPNPVGTVDLANPGAGSSGSIFHKTPIDETTPFRIRMANKESSFGAIGLTFLLAGYAGFPTLDDLGTTQLQPAKVSTSTNYLIYITSAGAALFWNGTIWTAGASTVSLNEDIWRFWYIISDGTSWHYRIEDADGNLILQTTPVTWALTKALGGGEDAYLVLSDIRSGGENLDMAFASVEMWPTELATTYLTSAQTCETDPFTFDEDFDSEDITLQLGRTPLTPTEIKCAVKEDAGAFGAAHNIDVTPIAGEAGWFALAAGTTYSSHSLVTLRPELNSPDTATQLKVIGIKIKGITVSGNGGGGGVFRSNICG